ncbi:MAG: nitrous oxide reductase family maturation protein NosD [Promethearchaeota archaeon]
MVNAKVKDSYNLAQINEENDKINPITSGSWILPPIKITGDLGWEAINSTYNWCNGAGTLNDPYILENITIDGGNSNSCIEIESSSIYFEIRNCTLFNSGDTEAGIFLFNVLNGKLIENNCSFNNGYGILLLESSDITISRNTANNNILGIYLYEANQNVVVENLVNENSNKGIYVRSNSNNNNLSQNSVNNNKDSGIYLSNSNYTDISHNDANGNTWDGIHLFGSDYNTISENTVVNNKHYGISLLRSSYNTIIDNKITYILKCIEEDDECEGNIISNNSCYKEKPTEIPGYNIFLLIGLIFTISLIMINKWIKN